MYLTILSAIFKRALALLASPWTWIIILAGTTIFCAYGWRGQIATTRQVTADCEARAEAVLRTNLELAAQAWQQVFAAHQEAVIRMSLAEAQQEANARHWRQRYAEALKASPACAAWAQEPITCPID